VDLERGPLSLVGRIEELLGRNNSGSGLEILEYGRRGSAALNTSLLYPQKLALISQTSGGRSVGIVRSRSHVIGFHFNLELHVRRLISNEGYVNDAR
jgi:hypothetical protein